MHRPVPRHWHEEFQLCLIEAGEGDLTYRGQSHPTPPASLFIVHPGEVHSNRSFQLTGCSYRTLFIEPEMMRSVAAELSGRGCGVPFFPSTIVFDKEPLSLFTRLHMALENSSATLERQTLLLEFIGHMVARFGEERASTDSLKRSRTTSIKRACEYLREHYAENVFLDELSALVNLSPFHFSRLFTEQVGIPPHAFQTQLRIARARSLLLRGHSISQIAARTGFADQSHLTRHFKRLVGVTPGQYRLSSKNVQDRTILL